MDRLTKEQIEQWRTTLCDPDDFHAHAISELNALCDLALQSLSQEAVRDEALRAVKVRRAERATVESAKWMSGMDDAIEVFLRALKREPNAAGQDTVCYFVERDDKDARWLSKIDGGPLWTNDPARACRWSTRKEAERMLQNKGARAAEFAGSKIFITEHLFMQPAPAAPDVASTVKRLRELATEMDGGIGWTRSSGLMNEAAALLAKLGQGVDSGE